MKLIIDIPKREYMGIKRYYDSLPEYSTVEAETYYIAHGTPLDDVKAKISRKANSGQWSEAVVYGMAKAIAILDNIGKAESEDT